MAHRVYVPVWSPLIRILHWTLAASVLIALFTGHDGGSLHEAAGYVALGCVIVRVALGFVGATHARFSDFLFGPKEVLAYARDFIRGRAPRFMGHNPLGGWMIVALLGASFLASASGVLFITEAYWGDEFVGWLHDASGTLIVALAVFHVLGVAAASWSHGENLNAAMITGRKLQEPR